MISFIVYYMADPYYVKLFYHGSVGFIEKVKALLAYFSTR